MYTLRQYLLSLTDSHSLTRTLGEIALCHDKMGHPIYTAGNSAVVFRAMIHGKMHALRCYLKPMRHLREIYGERLLEKELYIYHTSTRGEWVDVVVDEWIEGESLTTRIERASREEDHTELKRLAEAFDHLALGLIAAEWAHGDLKPDNIIVDSEGALHLIDWDTKYLPEFRGEASPELGTSSFQHPSRRAEDFDSTLDDYPVALISTALHALRIEPQLLKEGYADGLLFCPARIQNDVLLDKVLALFEHRGWAAQYRLAELLRSPLLHLERIGELLLRSCAEIATESAYIAREVETKEEEEDDMAGADNEEESIEEEGEESASTMEDATSTNIADLQQLNLYTEHGLWGYEGEDHQHVIPAMYDYAFEFSEGLAAVRLGKMWHYIDSAGHPVLLCPSTEGIKPFRKVEVSESEKNFIKHTSDAVIYPTAETLHSPTTHSAKPTPTTDTTHYTLRATILRQGKRLEIDPWGKILKIKSK